jgi:CRP/FNR family transcriptional regulator, cyclic AMP receptor protein
VNSSDKSAQDMALLLQGLGTIQAFAPWSAAALRELLQSARLGRYERGASVHREGRGGAEALVVLSGYLMVGWAGPGGEPLSLTLVGPGTLAGIGGEPEAHDETRYTYRAHDDGTLVAHLPAAALLGILDAEPSLWKGMAPFLLRQQRALLTTLLHQLSGPVRQRLAATLTRFSQIQGAGDSTGMLRLRLSQEDLAAMLQVTRQSINREMRAFEQRGLVSAEYGSVIVRKLAGLRALARGT